MAPAGRCRVEAAVTEAAEAPAEAVPVPAATEARQRERWPDAAVTEVAMRIWAEAAPVQAAEPAEALAEETARSSCIH
jgi:hypothetical protein